MILIHNYFDILLLPPQELSVRSSTIKVAGMLGQLVDLIEVGKAQHSSYGQDGYCEEVFLTTVQNLVHSVKTATVMLMHLIHSCMFRSKQTRHVINLLQWLP